MFLPTASAMPMVFRSSQNQNLNSGFRFGPVSWNSGSISFVQSSPSRLQKLPTKNQIPSLHIDHINHITIFNTHNPDKILTYPDEPRGKRGSQLKVFQILDVQGLLGNSLALCHQAVRRSDAVSV